MRAGRHGIALVVLLLTAVAWNRVPSPTLRAGREL